MVTNQESTVHIKKNWVLFFRALFYRDFGQHVVTLKQFNTCIKGLRVRAFFHSCDVKLVLAAILSYKGLQIVIRL